MELNQIKKLYEAMENNGFAKLEVEINGSECLTLKMDQAPDSRQTPGECCDSLKSEEDVLKNTQIEIRSDKVGVFSFADRVLQVGDRIKKGELLGVVKGISFQDKIKCSAGGTVIKVAIDNGGVVDYGKLLLVVEID